MGIDMENNRTEPFLTIGIASYNYAGYLDKALEQIKKQTFRDYEILYCDDGSTDGSVLQIRQYMEREKDIPIRLIEGEHKGLLANRNRILDNARGRYLMICDADDHMLDGCLEKLCSAAQEQDADCVIAGFCEISDEGKILKKHIPDVHTSKWLYTWHHGQIYKTDIIRQNAIRFEQVPDDVFYLQKVHSACKKVCFVPENVYAWCRHESSTSADYGLNQEWHPVKLWERIAVFTAELRERQEPEERQILNYYLYKWYYFNITDLWREEPGQVRRHIKTMQEKMREAIPDHRKVNRICRALSAKDTLFARTAVLFCWCLEKIHLTYVLVLARKLQRKL